MGKHAGKAPRTADCGKQYEPRKTLVARNNMLNRCNTYLVCSLKNGPKIDLLL